MSKADGFLHILIAGLLLCSVNGASEDELRPSHYDVQVRVKPAEGRIEVNARITFRPSSIAVKRVEFLLNRGLGVESAESLGGSGVIEVEKGRLGEFRYAQEAWPVAFVPDDPVNANDGFELELKYAGEIHADPWGVNQLTEDWIELGLYSAWFPLFPAGDFGFDIRIDLPEDYRVSGAGTLSRQDSQWRLTQSKGASDIVLISSRRLSRTDAQFGESRIVLFDEHLKPARRRQIVEDTSQILETISTWLGPSESQSLTVVLANRSKGGGYSRPGLIVNLYDGTPNSYPAFFKGLAHEAAHFWWRGAPVTTWEDWLNEAFAEYTSMMIVRELVGVESFEKDLAEYKQKTTDTGPIWGIDRSDEQAYGALYWKGSIILGSLEQRLGKKEFFKWLRGLCERKLKSTEAVLDYLEEVSSPSVRKEFEAALRR